MEPTMAVTRTPAQQLEGRTLTNGWIVEQLLERRAGATGGTFSEGYLVRNLDGRRGYLKALDYSAVLNEADPALHLQAMTTAYNFERSLLNRCRQRRLSRVVVSIDDGSTNVDPSNAAGVVQYLIFERADGDIRFCMDIAEKFSLAWILRSLHNTAAGLHQLHRNGIAHQDVKPSNILVFGPHCRIGDLGRAVIRGEASPNDAFKIAGDKTYAPPELLYGLQPSEWNDRRFACDMYLLGSMVVFLFSSVGMTPLLMAELAEEFHWRRWGGEFTEVLPFLLEAFERALSGLGENVGAGYADEVVGVVRQLCFPDPAHRGHPRARAQRGNPYDLQRFVTRFDYLARRAEMGLAGKVT